MKGNRNRWRILFCAIALDLLLCGFLWAFWLVDARSYNRMVREPAEMVQLSLKPNHTAQLQVVSHTLQWELPESSSFWYFWLGTLPESSGGSAAFLSRFLLEFHEPEA